MPTVHQEMGYKVYIYSGDHNPPHCHFVKAGEVAVVELNPVKITEYSSGFKSKLKEIKRIAEANQIKLLIAWDEIVGR